MLHIDEILLNPKTFPLNEVIVAKTTARKYLKISGYYRSTQLNNNEIQYFNDGVVEYSIDAKNNKIHPHLLNNRAFENKNSKQLTKKLHFSVVGVPNLYQENFANAKSIKFKKTDMFTEKICVYNDSSQIKNLSFLGNTSLLTNFSTRSIYSDTVNINHLTYFAEVRTYKIKSKKDIKYTNIEALHEFFVTDISYSDTKVQSNCRFYVFNREKKYDYPFWKDIKNRVYKNDNFTNQKFDALFEELND